MRARRMFLVALMLATAAVLQTTVLSRIPFPRATPDLVLLVIVGVALVLGPGSGAITGFAGGLLLDVLPPADSAVGRWALVLCVVGYLAGRASDAVEGSALLPLLVVAGCSALVILAYAAVGIVIGDGAVPVRAVVATLPAAVIYDVLLGAFVVPLVMKLTRRLVPTTTYAKAYR
jgi:rod shape-determining protein MreD